NPDAAIKVSKVLEPSATAASLENRLPNETKDDPKQEGNDLGQPSAYATRFVTRHLDQGNIVFVDMSVRSLAGKMVVHEGGAFYPQTRISWTCDPGLNPNVVN
ncbi:MAG: hypothetical protein ACXW3L_09130, partial [Limisphaerales bacterium]